MAVQIRDATPADEASCAALLAELGAAAGLGTDPRSSLRGAGPSRSPAEGSSEVFKMLLSKARGQIVLAVENGTVLGMATVSYNLALRYRGEYCQLEELIVSPLARGRNLGGRLVQAVVDNATRRGCGEIGLYLVERTEHNRAFYAKYGFEAVGTEMRQRLNE